MLTFRRRRSFISAQRNMTRVAFVRFKCVAHLRSALTLRSFTLPCRLSPPQVALRCDALTLNDVLQWPVVFQPLDEPISGPNALCALLEATLTGIPLAIPSAFQSDGRVTLALRQTIRGLPLCNDPVRSALVPRFEDITTTGSPVKCGFNCGFPHRPQKNWKLNYKQSKEARESRSCSKTFNATHGTTYGTLVGLCGCGCVQGSSTVVRAEGCKDIHAFLRRFIIGPVRTLAVG